MRHFPRTYPVRLMLLALILLLMPLLAVVRSQPVSAAGVVSQCTEASLRAALAGGGLVTFSCSGVIPIASQIVIAADTTIDGGGLVTLDGQDATRLFMVNGGIALELRGLTLTRGFAAPNPAQQGGGAVFNFGTLTVTASTFTENSAEFGGAIYNNIFGTLTLTASTLSGNRADFFGVGGAIYNDGIVTITASTLSGNHAALNGGAIDNFGPLTVTASTFTGNEAASLGGAITNIGPLTVTASTFTDNRADFGGAIDNFGTLTLTASTFTDNHADFGGAIYNADTLTLTASTLSGNSAGINGGAISNIDTLTVTASILSGSGGLCSSPVIITSGGYNVASDDSCNLTATGDLQNADPLLGNLQDNGGPTFTMLPQPGSPALDRVPNATCAILSAANDGHDQRGSPRPVDAYPCDSGAVEVGVVIQHIAISVAGGQATLQVTAHDPLGGPLAYRFTCAGVVLGPQPEPTASCDFGKQRGQFAVEVEVTDSHGFGMAQTVVVELPTYLCVGERSGTPRLMAGPGGCVRGEQPLVLTAVGSWSFCVGERSGSLRYLFNGNASCSRSEWQLTLPEQGPITVCVGERSRSMRVIAADGSCLRGEVAWRIANRVS